jgi:hypothetical protein
LIPHSALKAPAEVPSESGRSMSESTQAFASLAGIPAFVASVLNNAFGA